MQTIEKILLLLLLNILCHYGFSQITNLDSTFGINGKVITDISEGQASAIALQSDGKIVVTGYSWEGFAVTRYNNDGSLDSTFGDDGIVTTMVLYAAVSYSVAIQASGKILVLGGGPEFSAVIRYNVNGSIDNSFGTNGIRYVDLGAKLAILPDSRIIVAGTYDTGFPWHDQYIALTGLDSNGLNIQFTTLNSFGNYNASAYDVALQADGKIVTVGATDSNNLYPQYFAIARFTANGAPDYSFGINGHVTTSLNHADGAYRVAIQPDGKIVAVGSPLFTVARYNSDASLDNSFNGIGIVSIAIDTPSIANAVAIQADGKIVVAGTSYGGVSKFAVARFNTDGTLDNTFGIGGTITTDFGTYASGNAVALQADGKILVAGGESGFCMARYLPNIEVGILDFVKYDSVYLIHPNPIQSYATLQYTLSNKECLTISLFNMQGETVQDFINNESNNQESIQKSYK